MPGWPAITTWGWSATYRACDLDHRNRPALVAQTDATAIGLVPGQIDPEQEETLFTWLVRLTGQSVDEIRARYDSFPPGVDWYLPLGEVPADTIAGTSTSSPD